MSPGQVLQAYVGAFVDELARGGLRDVVVCPGSRSTPLALVLADHPGVTVWMHYDERSAAFFALGMARRRGEPVAVLCTSGTAAANFMPAVVEARYGRVPLLVLTADRPPELQEIGAPQTIDQTRLYGVHAKWFGQALLPEPTDDALRFVRTLAGRAIATTRSAPPGPVHLNFPFREPLIPRPVEPPPGADLAAWRGRPDGAPYVRVSAARRLPDPAAVERIARDLAGIERGLIVCGPLDDLDVAASVAELAEATGYPILADPLSGLRTGRHDRAQVVDAYDALLRDPLFVETMAPEVVLRIGAVPTSKPVLQYLQPSALGPQPSAPDRRPVPTPCRQIVVDEGAGWNEPTALAAEVVQADPGALCAALARLVERRGGSDWSSRWRAANRAARAAIAEQMAAIDEPFEGRAVAELADLLPDGATLWVGSSMPVRDLDTFFPATERRVRLLANRGANGIDGVVSSALGAAVDGGPLVLAIGDVSFYHDLNGLLAARLHRLSATVVLLHNDGGGIFSFLPQAADSAHFEQLFGTPHGLDFRPAVEMYGGRFERVSTWPDFRAAVSGALDAPGLQVIELRTERARNVELHRRFWPAVARAIAPIVGRQPSADGPQPSALSPSSPAVGRRPSTVTPSPSSLTPRPAPITPSDRSGGADPVRLAVEDLGGAGTPIVLLHGFTGSSESFFHLAPLLRDRWHAIAIDLPGHGRSDCPADPAEYRIERTVDDLLALLDRVGLERPHLLGYSMGGRVALHLALAAQQRFASLTLESASPGIVDPGERAARVASDEALAQLLDREGIEPFVDRWERAPLFASQAALPADVRARVRAQRLRSDPRGLAGSLRGFGAGVPEPLQARLPELRLPTLLIVGALDATYRRLGREMADAIPNARLEIVEGAGHAVHLERPEAFAAALRSFIRNLERTESALRLA